MKINSSNSSSDSIINSCYLTHTSGYWVTPNHLWLHGYEAIHSYDSDKYELKIKDEWYDKEIEKKKELIKNCEEHILSLRKEISELKEQKNNK